MDALLLENFQSHKHTELNLHKGINVIIGTSDSGKSAILRALSWCCYNDLQGMSFIRHGTERSSVAIFANGHKIVRSKGKGENAYTLDGAVFEAVRKDVPEEISRIFNVSDVNVQKQLDAHFMLSQSAGEAAKYFNAVLHLDEIDRASAWVSKLKRTTSAELLHMSKQSDSLSSYIEKYADLEKLESVHSELSCAKAERESLLKRRDVLQAQCAQFRAVYTSIVAYRKTERACTALLRVYLERVEVATRYRLLRESILAYRDVEKYCAFDANAVESILQRVHVLRERKSSVGDAQDMLVRQVRAWHMQEGIRLQCLESERTLAREMPDVCPLCGARV